MTRITQKDRRFAWVQRQKDLVVESKSYVTIYTMCVRPMIDNLLSDFLLVLAPKLKFQMI